jgi:hypothetical protein
MTNMEISKKSMSEFTSLFKSEFGEDLKKEDANRLAQNFLQNVELIINYYE